MDGWMDGWMEEWMDGWIKCLFGNICSSSETICERRSFDFIRRHLVPLTGGRFLRTALILVKLRWLPIAVQVEFKIWLLHLVHRALNAYAPNYIANCLTECQSTGCCALVNSINTVTPVVYLENLIEKFFYFRKILLNTHHLYVMDRAFLLENPTSREPVFWQCSLTK